MPMTDTSPATRPCWTERATMKRTAGPGVSRSSKDAMTNNPHNVKSGMGFEPFRCGANLLPHLCVELKQGRLWRRCVVIHGQIVELAGCAFEYWSLRARAGIGAWRLAQCGARERAQDSRFSRQGPR